VDGETVTRPARGRGARAFVVLALSICAVPAALAGTDFPVSGSITVNGTAGPLPAGGEFVGSSYDGATGEIGAGAFVFPDATIDFPSPLGTITATYRLTQTNTSTGLVAGDGVAALTVASMRLQVLSAVIGGIVQIPIGTCVFEPIDFELDGTGTVVGLDLADATFTIPAVEASACGGNGEAINDGIAGSSNNIALQVAGDFTPPTEVIDLIFADGFDG
jgi:hypothetical protein